jgi:predicted glycosyltransferase
MAGGRHHDLRVLTYSHDGYGMGHLRRSLKIASRLVEWEPAASVLVATGSRVAHRFELPESVDYLKLPAITKLANDRYVADGLRLDAEEVFAVRSAVLQAAVRHYAPDILLVDRYPLGVSRELEPALRALRSRRPDAQVILGLRDILDDPAVVREEWQRKGHQQAIAEYYDRVLVYGDPRVYDAVTEYGLVDPVARMVSFTGYLGDAHAGETAAQVRARLGVGDQPLAVCTVGGGKDAGHIANAFLDAMEHMREQGWKGLLVTGPCLDERERAVVTARAGLLGIPTDTFVADLPAHLAAADVAVAMGGYNTMCELLALAVPAVVIPRTTPRVEQLIRAARFAELGAIEVLHPDRLSGATLQRAMTRRAAVPRSQIRAAISAGADLHGLDTAADLLTTPPHRRRSLAS